MENFIGKNRFFSLFDEYFPKFADETPPSGQEKILKFHFFTFQIRQTSIEKYSLGKKSKILGGKVGEFAAVRPRKIFLGYKLNSCLYNILGFF